jgi:hypothetical protein
VRNITVPSTNPIEVVLIEGASVRGRLVRSGKPVANAPVELFLTNLESPFSVALGAPHISLDETNAGKTGGFSYRRSSVQPSQQIKSDREGSFVFRNLPEDAEFWVRSRVGNLPDEGSFAPRKLRTGVDKTEVDLGDVEVRRGRELSGQVIFSDGKPPRGGLGIQVSQRYPAASVWSQLDEMGRFDVRGLTDGPVRVEIAFPSGVAVARPGFRLSPKNKCFVPGSRSELAGQLDRDITDLTILFEQSDTPEPAEDASQRAAFEKASAGPITGISGGSGREK